MESWPIWGSTAVLILILAMIVRAEVRSTRRSKTAFKDTSRQIDDLATRTFNRHRELFGKDATGTFPVGGGSGPAKK